MAKKDNTLVSQFFNFFGEIADLLPLPLETPHTWISRAGGTSYKQYYHTVYRLSKRGVIKISQTSGKRFIKLTEKGQIEALLLKAKFERPIRWDKKWRLVIFDIPEVAHSKRDQLRFLLMRNGFKKLQASVFVSPYPISRAALEYLKKTKLQNFIRILRVDEIDIDSDLMKRFKIKV